MPGGETLDMKLVDHGVMPRKVEPPISVPAKVGIDYHAFGHESGAIAIIANQVAIGITELITEQAVIPGQNAVDGFGVRIEQELRVIEPLANRRVIRTMY